MKAVEVTIAGQTRYLAFTGEAFFILRERYESIENVIEAIRPDTREGYAALCEAAALLCCQGELARRAMGYDPAPMLTAEKLGHMLAPEDIGRLKLAVPKAIMLGFGREIEAEEKGDIDLGLAELTQKKNGMTKAHYIRMGITCGVDVKTALLMPPGELLDLFELYIQAHGLRKKEID